MKASTTFKSLAMLGLTSAALLAGSAQADYGYNGGYGNPWMQNQAMQQANYYRAVKERQARLDERQDNQLQRILNGIETGKLTQREAVALLREHLEIARMERRFMADGRLGPNELADLERRLDEASRHIQFEKNDRDQPRGGMDRPGEYGRR